MYSNVFQRFDVVGTYLSEDEKNKRLIYFCSPSSQIYKENVVYVGLLCNLFAVFLLYILTPSNIICPVLYKDMMNAKYFSQVYPQFRCWISLCWYRTLSTMGRQIWYVSVHSKIRSPLWYDGVWMLLPCRFVQCNIFCQQFMEYWVQVE